MGRRRRSRPADLAFGAQSQSWTLAAQEVDTGRWPELQAYSDALLLGPSFKALAERVSA